VSLELELLELGPGTPSFSGAAAAGLILSLGNPLADGVRADRQTTTAEAALIAHALSLFTSHGRALQEILETAFLLCVQTFCSLAGHTLYIPSTRRTRAPLTAERPRLRIPSHIRAGPGQDVP
jgi:hypothetical protein